MSKPGYEYVLFIDEAGDVGTRVRSGDGKGSTEWFALGGFVAAQRYEAEMADWVRSVRQEIGAPPDSMELHFNGLDKQRRINAATAIAKLPIRAFVVLSHKENMRGYQNSRAAKAGGRNVFYNFCVRVLLERATQVVARSCTKRFGEVRPMKTVIAETGGVRYDHTMEYLDKLRGQALTGTTYLGANTIHPRVASSWAFEKVSAKTVAGCQVADVITSSFYNAVHQDAVFPMLQDPALALRPIMARKDGVVANTGLKLLPWDRNIPAQYRPIFQSYGYGWEG